MIPAYLIILIALLFFGFLCMLRAAIGPTPADRIVATDFMGMVLVGFCTLYTMFSGLDFLIDIGLALAILGFIGTLALAKYLEGRSLDD